MIPAFRRPDVLAAMSLLEARAVTLDGEVACLALWRATFVVVVVYALDHVDNNGRGGG